VTRVLGQAAAAAGDNATAASALESAATSAAAPEADRRQLLAAAAGQYYALKEYSKAATVANRYLQAGGTDKSIRTIYVQSLYLAGNFAAAARELAHDVDAEEAAAGRRPRSSCSYSRMLICRRRIRCSNGRAMESSSPTTRSGTTG